MDIKRYTIVHYGGTSSTASTDTWELREDKDGKICFHSDLSPIIAERETAVKAANELKKQNIVLMAECTMKGNDVDYLKMRVDEWKATARQWQDTYNMLAKERDSVFADMIKAREERDELKARAEKAEAAVPLNVDEVGTLLKVRAELDRLRGLLKKIHDYGLMDEFCDEIDAVLWNGK